MKSTEPADYQQMPRPIAAMPADFPSGQRIPGHRHARAQLLLASGGAIEITVGENIWVVPSGRAVWIPAGVEHAGARETATDPGESAFIAMFRRALGTTPGRYFGRVH